ncbi:hypothetical protein DPMN_115907 [Dreissena polymorpha]|uniref:Uncharacterized protein n=1 Tax=Dreissena polymorpha TaxID=45954 RepID=A0A9D4KNR7_DREPO|nr:hypothetical protein DPMN_115907 [Dreissena polymorpha]
MQGQLVREGTGRVRRNTYVNLYQQLGQLWDEYDQRELTTENSSARSGRRMPSESSPFDDYDDNADEYDVTLMIIMMNIIMMMMNMM